MEVTLIEIAVSGSLLLILGFFAGLFIFKKAISVGLRTQLQEKVHYINKLEKELAEERDTCKTLLATVSSKDTEIDNLNDKLAVQKKEIEDLNTRFQEEFKKISNQLLIDNSNDLSKKAVDQLNTILTPFKEHINNFSKKIDDNREKQFQESTTLQQQIAHLMTLNQTMTDEAKNLTNALKGESKTRGNWGEMILEKILDSSGLIRDEHYTLQTSLTGEDSKRKIPDVIINLPEDKNIVIDSKLSLVDYERYCNTEDDLERSVHLKNHLNSIRQHIKDLGSKEYQKSLNIDTPDFVLMFIPIEAALLTALECDNELFNYGLNRNIVLISPTTLIPTLKIIHSIWRQESQNRNALEIADTGGKLYDKFVGFVNDLDDVGSSLDKTRKAYDNAVKKLSTGKGNAIGLAEKMKEMGAKASKQLPAGIELVE